MNRNENIGNMSSLCDLFRLFQIHIWQFAVCLVNAMQAVVREGVTTLGESMTVTHKQTQADLTLVPFVFVQTNVKTPEIRN